MSENRWAVSEDAAFEVGSYSKGDADSKQVVVAMELEDEDQISFSWEGHSLWMPRERVAELLGRCKANR